MNEVSAQMMRNNKEGGVEIVLVIETQQGPFIVPLEDAQVPELIGQLWRMYLSVPDYAAPTSSGR